MVFLCKKQTKNIMHIETTVKFYGKTFFIFIRNLRVI